MDDDVTTAVPRPLRDLRALAARLHDADRVGRLLAWDERVTMPAPGAESRARQRAWAAAEAQQLRASDDARQVLAAALDWDARHPEVDAMRRELERSWRIPAEHVARAVEASARGASAWNDARRADDASRFVPALTELLEVAREEAALVDGDRDPYEVLLRRWEPGVDAQLVATMLERLAARIGPSVRAAAPVESLILDRPLSQAKLEAIERMLVEPLGLDLARCRIDHTERAFCTTIGVDDVRITSRLGAVPGLRNLRSSMHEAGHAIYAQGMHRLGLAATLDSPPGLGIDESQSRLFERFIGASRAFWTYHFPRLVDHAPETFTPDELEELLVALQAPAVSLVRIDSGDGAYDLHVLLRMRLERALVDGSLEPAGLATAWNEQVRELLGLEVSSDVLGCLQDVHWSMGSWGYFPTYSLGNILAAQLLQQARADLPSLDESIARTGSTRQLLDWLDEHVYRHGRSLTSFGIVEQATGCAPSEDALVRHLMDVGLSAD